MMTNLSGANLNNASAVGSQSEGRESPSHSLALMPKYEDYVDSGVEWLGRVPSHWQITRLKNTINGCVNGLWGADPNGKDELVIVRVADFDEQKLNVSDEKLTYRSIPENERKNRLLKFGDLLIEKSGGGDKTLVGRVVLFDKSYTAVTSNFVAKMTPKNWVNHSFLKYVFFSLYSRGVNYVSIKQTTGIQNLDANSYLNEVFCFPDEFVQAEVANFLDKKTAQIDEAIAIKEKQIALLKERKQIIIQKAVTQGLDPNVPMKDSGVDWIGQIPAHWEVKKLKFFCKFNGGGTPSKDNQKFWENGNIPWVSPKDMKFDKIIKTQDYITPLAVKNSATNYVSPNSLLLVVRSGILQRKIPVAINDVTVTLNQDMKALSLHKSVMTSEYLKYFIKGNNDSLLVEWTKEGATVESIEHEFIANGLIPIPPLEEQEKIVDYLKKLDKSMLYTNENQINQIEKLKEYKTTLINSAVTGKIKVA